MRSPRRSGTCQRGYPIVADSLSEVWVRGYFRQPQGMTAFSIVWFGQLISFVGSGLTGFTLGYWAWELTGRATALALTTFFGFAPTVLLSPLAGALIDRWNRKLVMILTDVAAGLSTIALLALYLLGRLEIWHIYVATAFAGAFQAFQWPAYSAAITMMVPQRQRTRANGMMALADFGAVVASPLLAGLLITNGGIAVAMAIDIVTFVIAVVLLTIVRIPQPARQEGDQASLWSDTLYGFKFILERPSMLGLQLVFFVANMLDGFSQATLGPMILARTGSNASILGFVESVLGVGGVLGGVLMSTWGGPRRRISGVLGGWLISSIFGTMLLGLGNGLVVWSVAMFFRGLTGPVINSSNQAIWQAKVPPAVQGRVFAVRRMIAQISFPLALLVVGPLADYVLEPGMQPGGSLATVFGALVEPGRGAGFALLQVFAGVLSALAIGVALTIPAIRNVESIMPDCEVVEAQPA